MESLQEFVDTVQAKIKEHNFPYGLKSVIHVYFMVNSVFERLSAFDDSHSCSTAQVIDHLADLYSEYCGPMYSSVLNEVKISTWHDIGNIILFLTDVGVYKRSKDDRIEDYSEADRNSPMPALIGYKYKQHIEKISNGKANFGSKKEEAGSDRV